MAFSINTNVASLQAQNYLMQSSNFQSKTIGEVTSGLRIVNSGDDAAGLAVANGDRSNEAVLTQGILNANDGLSQLQIIDGGMNNISQLLDRARTLAAQSASGAFTGDRTALNSEFQSVVSEIDRQAQAIGMNQNGTFAKSLSVFVGGGQGSTAAAQITNGSIGVDLSNATVDAKSLGLNSYKGQNTHTYDLSATSATSVSQIIANEGKDTSGNAINTATFTFSGAGFANDTSLSTSAISVTISTQGITDAAGLATAINNAIYSAANPTGTSSTPTGSISAFKAAGITASVVTNSSGQEQLAFNSSSAAFQVSGDKLANAFMGYVADSRTGKVAGEGSTYVQAATNLGSVTTDLSTVKLKFTNASGTALSTLTGTGSTVGTVDFDSTMNGSSSTLTAQQVVDNINTLLDAAANATTAGTTSNIRAELKDGKLAFTALNGTEFNVQVTGDAYSSSSPDGVLGFNGANEAQFTPTGLTTASASDFSATTLNFTNSSGGTLTGTGLTGLSALGAMTSGNGFSTTAPATVAQLASNINAYLDAKTGGAGTSVIRAKADADGTHLDFYSTDGSAFKVTATAASGTGATDMGMVSGTATATTFQASQYQALTSGGVYQSAQEVSTGSNTDNENNAYNFTGLASGQTQSITVNTLRTDGSTDTYSMSLTSSNAATVGAAVKTINNYLQQTGDPVLQGITAIRDQNGIRFVSAQAFSVALGTTTGTNATTSTGLYETVNSSNKQGGIQLNSTVQGTSGMADISTQAGAESAVSLLATAVQSLGQSQSVVGRSENQLNYAVNLAQSQLTNTQAAESRIRDADLAAQSANLTKAQILMQAGVAALAQANSAPQSLLKLLG